MSFGKEVLGKAILGRQRFVAASGDATAPGATLTGASDLTAGAASGGGSSNSINILSPVAYQLIRRGNNPSVDIPVSVEWTGTPSAIEIRWNGGAWQSFTPTVSPQTCNLTGCARGYGALEARFANDLPTAASVTPVAVGKAISGWGQSNMSGRGSANQAAPAAGAYLFDGAGAFRALIDPTDGLPYGGTATYSVLDDGGSAAGSYLPRLAQRFIDDGEPTLYIPCNKGSTSISSWSRSLLTTTLYGAAKARVDAAGGADIIIWHQGENEAFGAPSQSAYETNLSALVANLASDFGNPVVLVQKIHTMAGYESGCAIIRAAQENVIAAGLNGIRRGADMDGVTTAVHYTTNAQLTDAADRTYAALTSSTAPGATLTGASDLTAGAANGEQNAVAPGATLNGSSDISAGSAGGEQNASAPGATLTGASSIAAGSASGGAGGDATAPGASLIGASDIAAGAATGEQNASAPGTTLNGSGQINAGAASSSVLTTHPRYIIKAPARRFVITR